MTNLNIIIQGFRCSNDHGFTYLTLQARVLVAFGERISTTRKIEFFTQQEQNLQLATNSTASVSTVYFQDSTTQIFQTKTITEQFERSPGAFPIKTYSSFTMRLLWVTDQQWEDCYQFAKIQKKWPHKIVVTKVSKNSIIFPFCFV